MLSCKGLRFKLIKISEIRMQKKRHLEIDLTICAVKFLPSVLFCSLYLDGKIMSLFC